MKINLILTLIAAALVAFIFMEAKQETGPIKLIDIKSSDIRKVVYTTAGSEQNLNNDILPLGYTLFLDNQSNFKLGDLKKEKIHDIDRRRVEQILSNTANIEVLRIIKEDASLSSVKAIKKEYGIDFQKRRGVSNLEIEYRVKHVDKKTGIESFEDKIMNLVFGRPGVREGLLYALDSKNRILMIAESQKSIFDCTFDDLRDKRLLPVNPFNLSGVTIERHAIKGRAIEDAIEGHAIEGHAIDKNIHSSVISFKRTDSYKWQLMHPKAWEADWKKLYHLLTELQEPVNAHFIDRPENLEKRYTLTMKESAKQKPLSMVFYAGKDFKGLAVKSSVSNSWIILDDLFNDKLSKSSDYYIHYRAASFETHLARRVVIDNTLVEQSPIDWRWYFSKRCETATDSRSAATKLFTEQTMYGPSMPGDLKTKKYPHIKFRISAGLVEALAGNINALRINSVLGDQNNRPLQNPDIEFYLVTVRDMQESTHLFQAKKSSGKGNEIIWYNSDYNQRALLHPADYSRFKSLVDSLKKDISRF